jgi:hypothetical protein
VKKKTSDRGFPGSTNLGGRLRFLAAAALVFSSFFIPFVWGGTAWPWTDYPMFSYPASMDKIATYQLFLREKSTGRLIPMGLNLTIRTWHILERTLASRDLVSLRLILRADAIHWPENEDAYQSMIVSRLKKKPGTTDYRSVEKEDLIEIPIH